MAKKLYLQEMNNEGYTGGKIRIAHCDNEDGARELEAMIRDRFGKCDIQIIPCRGLCSFYAEKGGLLVGFEE